MKRAKIIAALALLLTFLAPTFASAVDIPLLTWERGRVQEVVLGGGAYNNKWVVTLEGNGTLHSLLLPALLTPLVTSFTRSRYLIIFQVAVTSSTRWAKVHQ